MPGSVSSIMLVGDLPDVVVDLPAEFRDIGAAPEPVTHMRIRYGLEQITQTDKVITAVLTVRHCHVLASGRRLEQEQIQVPLTFTCHRGTWDCQVGKAM